jgi:hypothetical protein
VNNPSAFWAMRHENLRNRPQNKDSRSEGGACGPGLGRECSGLRSGGVGVGRKPVRMNERSGAGLVPAVHVIVHAINNQQHVQGAMFGTEQTEPRRGVLLANCKACLLPSPAALARSPWQRHTLRVAAG